MFHSNYVPILHCFEILRYWSNIAGLYLPHLYLAPQLGVTTSDFCCDLWRQKTKVPVLSLGVVCVILRLAILVQCRLVTDGRTHDDSIYCTSVASRGKKAAF